MTSDPTRQLLLTDDGSYTLWDAHLDETFHSCCGAISESLTVYLINSGVAERLRTKQPTLVVEYGFGTGSSFLLTAALAEAAKVPLRYVGLEIDLLPPEIVALLDPRQAVSEVLSRSAPNICFPDSYLTNLQHVQAGLLDAWQSFRADESSTLHQVDLTPYVTLELFLGDALLYPRICEKGHLQGLVHAIYFDPFAPDKDPGLWNASVFQSTYDLLEPGGALTTYCVKSSVRKLLQSVGYQLEKLAGPPGGKREVLRAKKPRADADDSPLTTSD